MVLFGVLSNLAIILQSDRAVCFNCVVAVYVLCLFLKVPWVWVGLQSVIVACPVLTYYLFCNKIHGLKLTDG